MQNLESYAYLFLFFLLLGIISLLNQSVQKKKKKQVLRGIETCTENGELVKSKAEARIADFLKKKKVLYEYEKPLVLEGRMIRPDFYLEKYDVYIEYYGWYHRQEKYTKDADEKRARYKRNKIKVISIFPEEYRNIENRLNTELNWLEFYWFIKTLIKKLKNLFS